MKKSNSKVVTKESIDKSIALIDGIDSETVDKESLKKSLLKKKELLCKIVKK